MDTHNMNGKFQSDFIEWQQPEGRSTHCMVIENDSIKNSGKYKLIYRSGKSVSGCGGRGGWVGGKCYKRAGGNFWGRWWCSLYRLW